MRKSRLDQQPPPSIALRSLAEGEQRCSENGPAIGLLFLSGEPEAEGGGWHALEGDRAYGMWGVNGACGVLAGVTAVRISMWSGIAAGLFLAALCHALLLVPALQLWRRIAGG